jgi:hypothetical protein
MLAEGRVLLHISLKQNLGLVIGYVAYPTGQAEVACGVLNPGLKIAACDFSFDGACVAQHDDPPNFVFGLYL